MPVEGVKATRDAEAQVRAAERNARRAEQAAESSESEKRERSEEGKGSKVNTSA